MDSFWESFDREDAAVCVIDAASHKIVYANDRMCKWRPAAHDFVGERCYEVLQGFAAPCSFCSISTMQAGDTLDKVTFDQVTDRPLRMSELQVERGGRLYRIEAVCPLREDEFEYHRYAGLDANTILLNDCLHKALEQPDPDKSILAVLEHVGQALGADRAYIFEDDPRDASLINNTYEWCSLGTTPEIASLQHVLRETSDLWRREFEKGLTVVVPCVEDLRQTEPQLYDYLAPQNISSLAACQLTQNNRAVGLFGFDNPNPDRLDDIYPVLKTIGHFLDSLMERRSLVRKLEALSYTDQMTGLGNRYALEKCYAELPDEKSVGIVFCDVCGLKEVNDSLGHARGDDLLVRASALLDHVFDGCRAFRVGGDELVVLVSGLAEDAFARGCDDLRRHSAEQGAPLAVGGVWRPRAVDVRDSLAKLLDLADGLMYEDKRSFYRRER